MVEAVVEADAQAQAFDSRKNGKQVEAEAQARLYSDERRQEGGG